MDTAATKATEPAYQVVCLKEGYAFTNDQGQMKACGSVTVLLGAHKIIVDTGGPADASAITSGLEKLGLKCSDIDYVVGTHGHSDHVGNLNLFPGATCIVSHDVCRGDVYIDHEFDAERPVETAFRIDAHVSVMATPGHTCSDVSVVVSGTQHGTVVVAGDIFERAEDLEDESLWSANSFDAARQRRSRALLLGLADHIVPGHGPMFPAPPRTP